MRKSNVIAWVIACIICFIAFYLLAQRLQTNLHPPKQTTNYFGYLIYARPTVVSNVVVIQPMVDTNIAVGVTVGGKHTNIVIKHLLY